jgi:low temperature requirement protein LtrA
MPDQQEKKWYASKTLWVNLLSVIALVVQTQTGFIVDAEAQVALLGVINLVLRAVTKSHLNWK